MPSIANLSLNIVARTRELRKGLKKAESRVLSFTQGVESKVGRVVGRFGPMLAKISAIAGIGGVGFLTKSTLESVDAAAKLAGQLDTTTTSILALQRGAGLAGANTRDLNNALRAMQRRAAQAAEGSGMARQALLELGFSLDNIRELGASELFFQVAGALENVETAADRTRLAFDIFGRSGERLLTMLNQGEESLRGLVPEFERIFGAVDDDAASNIESFNDAMSDLKLSMQGLINVGLTNLVENLDNIVRKVTDMITVVREGDSTIVNVIVEFAKWAAAIWATSKAVRFIVSVGSKLVFNVQRVVFIVTRAVAAMKGLGVVAVTLKAIGVALVAIFGKLALAIGAVVAVASGLVWVWNKFTGETNEFADAAPKIQDELEATKERLEELQSTAERTEVDLWPDKAQRDSEDAIDMLSKIVREYDQIGMSAEQIKIVELRQAGATESTIEFATELVNATAAWEDYLDRMSRVETAISDVQRRIREFNKSESQVMIQRLHELGASADQIDLMRESLERLANMQAGAEAERMMDRLAGKIARHGKNAREQFILEWRKEGLPEESLSEALGMFDLLDNLESVDKEIEDIQRTMDNAMNRLQNQELAEGERTIRAGSAESRQLAHMRGQDMTVIDDVAREQLKEAREQLVELRRMRELLEERQNEVEASLVGG